MTALVVGIGNPAHGDDAIGPLVAATVGCLALPDVEVAAHDGPLALVEYLAAYDDVVVVDAARTPSARPGHVHVIQVDGTLLTATTAAIGLHGVVDAVELARERGRLPTRLTLVRVEADVVEPGGGVTPSVASGLDAAVHAVLEALPRTWR